MTRPPATRRASISAAVAAECRTARRSGSSAIELGVAGRRNARRVGERRERRSARAERTESAAQSRMKPADGGSNATGGLAMRVQVSQIASGCGTYAYWIGRPWRASPSQISADRALKAQLDQPRMREHARHDRTQRSEPQRVAGLQHAAAAAAARSASESRRRRTRRP